MCCDVQFIPRYKKQNQALHGREIKLRDPLSPLHDTHIRWMCDTQQSTIPNIIPFTSNPSLFTLLTSISITTPLHNPPLHLLPQAPKHIPFSPPHRPFRQYLNTPILPRFHQHKIIPLLFAPTNTLSLRIEDIFRRIPRSRQDEGKVARNERFRGASLATANGVAEVSCEEGGEDGGFGGGEGWWEQLLKRLGCVDRSSESVRETTLAL